MGAPDDPGYSIEQIDVARALTLRHALLNPAGPGTSVVHAGDHDSASMHFGAYRNDVLIGVATLIPAQVPGAGSSVEVTGVAVEHGHRGRGIGHLLLDACIAAATDSGAASLTAAVPALAHGFFRHEGFGRVGDPYEAVDGTPHYRMARPLDPDSE
ncbi:GNAT family N-acetyltransferase [bacterium]|nr:GNAT family N-acetyltransferase [bacterium]